MSVSIAGLALAYGVALQAPAGLFHDDGIYAVTAKALASGDGYYITSLPTPIAQTKYPILFPALLAGIWKIYPSFPANLPALKIVPVLAALLWLWLSYRLLVEEGMPSKGAVCCLLLAAATDWVVLVSTLLLSETLFAALCMAVLLSLRRMEGRRGAMRACGAGVLIGLAMLTRTAGVALLGAGTFVLLRQRAYRDFVLLAMVAILIWAPWLGWTSMHKVPPDSTEAYYTAENYRAWNLVVGIPADQAIVVALANVAIVFGSLLVTVSLPGTAVLLAATVFCYGVWRDARCGRPTVGHIFMLCYVGMLVLWAWPPQRFLAIILPLILFVFWRAMERVWPVSAVRTAASLGLGALLLVNVWAALPIYAWQDRDGRNLSFDTRTAASLTSWIQQSTSPDAVLMSNADPFLYLYTGRKAYRGYVVDPLGLFYDFRKGRNPVAEPSKLEAEIRRHKATHIVVVHHRDAESEGFNRAVTELVKAKPQAFRIATRWPGMYTVYEIGSW